MPYVRKGIKQSNAEQDKMISSKTERNKKEDLEVIKESLNNLIIKDPGTYYSSFFNKVFFCFKMINVISGKVVSSKGQNRRP